MWSSLRTLLQCQTAVWSGQHYKCVSVPVDKFESRYIYVCRDWIITVLIPSRDDKLLSIHVSFLGHHPRKRLKSYIETPYITTAQDQKDTKKSNTSGSYLDIKLDNDTNGDLTIRLYDKRCKFIFPASVSVTWPAESICTHNTNISGSIKILTQTQINPLHVVSKFSAVNDARFALYLETYGQS